MRLEALLTRTAGQLNFPSGLSFGADGTVYIADRENQFGDWLWRGYPIE